MKKLVWVTVCALMAFGSLIPLGISAQDDDAPQPPPPGITIENVTLSCTGLVTFSVANPNDIGANREAYISIYRITELFGGGDSWDQQLGELFLLTQGQSSYSYQFSNGSTWSENYKMDKIFAVVADNEGNPGSHAGRSDTLSCFTGPPLAPTTYALDSAMCDGTGRVTVSIDPRRTELQGFMVQAFDADTGALVPGTTHQYLQFFMTQSQSFSLGSLVGTKNVIVNFQGIHQGETDLTKGSSIQLDCSIPDPQPTATSTSTATATATSTATATATATTTATATVAPPNTPVPNAFALTTAMRACADQTFSATWSGSNLTAVEFALSNTSDEWTSGWLAADPAAGSFTSPVDHHGYDKVVARVTFADGTTQQQDADVGTCNIPAAPEQPLPPTVPSQPSAPSQPGSSTGNANAVTSLPKTGAGVGRHTGIGVTLTIAGIAVIGVIGFAVTRKPTHI